MPLVSDVDIEITCAGYGFDVAKEVQEVPIMKCCCCSVHGIHGVELVGTEKCTPVLGTGHGRAFTVLFKRWVVVESRLSCYFGYDDFAIRNVSMRHVDGLVLV